MTQIAPSTTIPLTLSAVPSSTLADLSCHACFDDINLSLCRIIFDDDLSSSSFRASLDADELLDTDLSFARPPRAPTAPGSFD